MTSGLRKRIATAVVLGGLFLLGVSQLDIQWMALAFGVVATAGAWEWARLACWKATWQRVIYSVVLPVILWGLWQVCGLPAKPAAAVIQPWLGGACLLWCVSALMVRGYPNSDWVLRSRLLSSVLGWLLLAATWLSLLYFLTLRDGAMLLVIFIVAVAAADIGAYFSGHQWGKHKLAPRVSPGKTWEGFLGGVVSVLLLTTLVWFNLPNSDAHLRIQSVFILGLVLAGTSVLGDLTVSMVKRSSGCKDSGGLLPGHGGLLDRIDSIAGAAPAFALGLLLIGY